MIYTGIDPGNDGGVAALSGEDHLVIYGVYKDFPTEVIRGIASICCAAIEDNTCNPGMMRGVKAYYENIGRAKQWCDDCGIAWEPVAARRWQAQLLKGVPGANTKQQAYNYLLAVIGMEKMRELGIVTARGKYKDGLGDALCIALWLKAQKEAER